MKSLSVVLPAFNEEANIRAVVEDAHQTVPKLIPIFEIIVVNDGSKDRTGEICDRLAEELSNVRVVHHHRNRGYGAALKSGITLARHEGIFFTDADGQFDLKEVAALLEQADAYDIVAGYRVRRQDPPHRLLFAWGWNILVRLVLGIRIRDIDCAFKVFNRRVFDKVQINSVGAMVNTEIFAQVSRFGMKVKEVPVSHFPRRHGKPTGGNVAVIVKAFRELIKIRRKAGRIAAVIGRLRRLQARQAELRQIDPLCTSFCEKNIRSVKPIPTTLGQAKESVPPSFLTQSAGLHGDLGGVLPASTIRKITPNER